jgi:hypothetical protein
MLIFFSGMGISLGYGLFGAGLIWFWLGITEAQNFFSDYVSSFRAIISLGIILGTALIVRLRQNDIPAIIEDVFTEEQRSNTDYTYYKQRFSSLRVTLTFMSEFIVVGWVIFYYCHFPHSDLAENLMLIAVCAQYAFGVYVGRKLIYTGMMLHSLMDVKIRRNLFEKRELDDINWYVNVASTLTIIFVYIHVVSYYGGPFGYDRFLGQSIKTFIILPAIIATPVLLIFNFYPRAVLQKLYSRSIDIALKNLQKKMQNETFTPYEKRSYLIEFDKMSREQLRYSLRLELTDIPIGITILIMVLQPLLKP